MTVIGEELDAVVFEDWLLGGKGAGLLVFRRQVASGDLAGFDIGLVEGVDADDRAGDRGGDFPAEEFLAEIVNVGERDADDRMAGLFERRDFGVLSRRPARIPGAGKRTRDRCRKRREAQRLRDPPE